MTIVKYSGGKMLPEDPKRDAPAGPSPVEEHVTIYPAATATVPGTVHLHAKKPPRRRVKVSTKR